MHSLYRNTTFFFPHMLKLFWSKMQLWRASFLIWNYIFLDDLFIAWLKPYLGAVIWKVAFLKCAWFRNSEILVVLMLLLYETLAKIDRWKILSEWGPFYKWTTFHLTNTTLNLSLVKLNIMTAYLLKEM